MSLSSICLLLHVIREFSVQWADEESDAAFAYRVMNEPYSDLTPYLWNWKNGDWASFIKVLTLAFYGENKMWDIRRNLAWQIQLPGKEKVVDAGRYFRIGKNRDWIEVSRELQVAYKHVSDYFSPTLNEEALESHLSVARYYFGARWFSRDFRQPFEISIQYPTDARRKKESVKWHKWLQAILKSEELS